MRKFFSLMLFTAFLFASCQSHKDGLYAKIETNQGTMEVELYYKQTPITVANFVSLAEGTNPFVKKEYSKIKYYDGTVFHRVIKNFMIQGGDREATGEGTPGYDFADEFVETLKFDTDKGFLAMANAGPKTNGSQFFITQVPTPWLTGKHTIFGKIVSGFEIVEKIANVKTNEMDKPLEDVVVKKITIIRAGKDAKKFDAEKVFSDYMKKENEAKKGLEERGKALAAEFQKQKSSIEARPSGIRILTLKEGKVSPKEGEKLNVFYAGYFEKDGRLFDSNVKEVAMNNDAYIPERDAQGGYGAMPAIFSKDMPFIPGFKEAMLSMKKGDKVRVFIPSNQAYGERGAGGVIPPNTDLVFDLEITE